MYIESLTKRVRYDNRFAEFALKYIDTTALFTKFRFQITLGKLQLAEYDKMLDEELVKRNICVNPNAFGQLNEFSDIDKICRIMQIDKNSFEQFSPHYNMENNKIAISSKAGYPILLDKNKGNKNIPLRIKQPQPEAFLSLHELPKIILLENLCPGDAERLIQEFIDSSKNKILNPDIIEEIKTKLPEDWDEFKKRRDTKTDTAYNDDNLEILQKRKLVLNTVLAPYGLNDKQIPTKILEYWLNIRPFESDRIISDTIKRMKSECKERIYLIRKNEKDETVKLPKVGEMATFITRDIIDMIISETKKEKITSFYYDKMQECLAYYPIIEKKNLFLTLITKELGLYETDGHPFLKEIDFENKTYIKDIYNP